MSDLSNLLLGSPMDIDTTSGYAQGSVVSMDIDHHSSAVSDCDTVESSQEDMDASQLEKITRDAQSRDVAHARARVRINDPSQLRLW